MLVFSEQNTWDARHYMYSVKPQQENNQRPLALFPGIQSVAGAA